MKYPSKDSNPFAHLAQPQYLDSAEVVEIIEDDITDKIEHVDEFAHQIEEETRKAAIHGIGAMIDAMAVNGIPTGQRGLITATAIELLKSRKIVDLRGFRYSKHF